MSIYSGFSSRKQESTYNSFVFKAIQVIASELMHIRQMGMITCT